MCGSEVKWSLDSCFGKDGHVGILDLPGSAWFCMNELLLPGAAGDLPRLNYFYIAAKFIADSHLLLFFLTHSRKQLKGICHYSSHPEHLSQNLPPKVERCKPKLVA